MTSMLLAIEVMDVLIPVLILLGIALVLGVVICVLNKVLSVEKDAKIEQVREKLSGANCGGCGFPGCDGFAEALCKGEAKISGCAQITKENVIELNAILGTNETGAGETVCVIRCNGGNNAKDKFEYKGYGDCKSSEMLGGGSKMCSNGCMGLGTCVSACTRNAVDGNDKSGCAKIDPKTCGSCGLCIKECPKGLIVRIPKSAKIYVACNNKDKGKDVMAVCKAGCIACGMCARVCNNGAITIENNLPVIDYSKCTGCYDCLAKCPTKVIKKVYDK